MKRALRPLVDVASLHDRMTDDRPGPTLLDVRWSLGAPSQRPAYDDAHLPGAAWVEFEDVCSGVPGPQGTGGRHPMPDRAVFQSAMQAAGVCNDRPVVIYDGANSLAASRCWWLVRYFGKEDVQVLDGGLAAWTAAGLALEALTPVVAGDFVATNGHVALLDAEEAADHAERSMLLDARPASRYAGQQETVDPVAGHIPGAVSAPALENLQSDGRFLTPDDLAMRFTALGVRPESEVGTYCGSGVQATHLALALEVSGIHPQSAVYIGSWSDWITDPDRPVATGPVT